MFAQHWTCHWCIHCQVAHMNWKHIWILIVQIFWTLCVVLEMSCYEHQVSRYKIQKKTIRTKYNLPVLAWCPCTRLQTYFLLQSATSWSLSFSSLYVTDKQKMIHAVKWSSQKFQHNWQYTNFSATSESMVMLIRNKLVDKSLYSLGCIKPPYTINIYYDFCAVFMKNKYCVKYHQNMITSMGSTWDMKFALTLSFLVFYWDWKRLLLYFTNAQFLPVWSTRQWWNSS